MKALGKTGLTGVILAASLGLGLAGCGDKPSEKTAVAAAPRAGRLTVAMRTVAEMKPVAGEITTRDLAEARARIGGTLTTLLVREGAVVKAGQTIGVVTDARLGLETSAYDSLVSAAAGEADRAAADLKRTRQLYDKGVYAKARLDQVEAAAKAAQGNLDAARARRAASAEVAAQGLILAPAAGRVLKADVPPGSVVAPGQSIAQITNGPVVVRITLPEGQARSLTVGAAVRIWPDGPGGAEIIGTIAQVYPAVETGLVVADVSAPGVGGELIGRRVSASVQVGQRQAIVIPRGYLVTRFGVDYVRLVRADGVAADSPVQTAPGPGADEVEILSGLSAGDSLALPEGGR
ncbi:MAG: efflux RND transporter periplasmic adaptor subunit [Caulobacter sp.]|nr:efflux RND transporter periplasmic adaptor subunit [Caulobacter sp.]